MTDSGFSTAGPEGSTVGKALGGLGEWGTLLFQVEGFRFQVGMGRRGRNAPVTGAVGFFLFAINLFAKLDRRILEATASRSSAELKPFAP